MATNAKAAAKKEGSVGAALRAASEKAGTAVKTVDKKAPAKKTPAAKPAVKTQQLGTSAQAAVKTAAKKVVARTTKPAAKAAPVKAEKPAAKPVKPAVLLKARVTNFLKDIRIAAEKEGLKLVVTLDAKNEVAFDFMPA